MSSKFLVGIYIYVGIVYIYVGIVPDTYLVCVKRMAAIITIIIHLFLLRMWSMFATV